MRRAMLMAALLVATVAAPVDGHEVEVEHICTVVGSGLGASPLEDRIGVPYLPTPEYVEQYTENDEARVAAGWPFLDVPRLNGVAAPELCTAWLWLPDIFRQ